MKTLINNTIINDVSNLIVDMTLLGASNEEMERAVKLSMYVIDNEKEKYRD